MIWANLAVSDINRTTRFYTQLGFKSNGASDELCSFYFGENNLIINFFLKEVLKANVEGEIADLKQGNEIVFTLSAARRHEVDLWEQEVLQAGGIIVSGVKEFGKAYYGFVFTDPDGHKFNVFNM
jgi:predicted lactoylglutathione lyase